MQRETVRIPLVDLKRQYQSIRSEVDSAIRDVLESGIFILGHNVLMFEREFASFCGAKSAIGVASGSDALLLSLQAIGIGRSDEVITASNTFISTVDAIHRNNAQPILVDIDPSTYTMDVDAVRKKVGPKTRAIIPVHMYGHPADMAPLCELAEERDLTIIEDACQAHGAEYHGKRAGSFGGAACFSFYPSKNLGAYGDAGMVVTNDPEIADNITSLRDYGQTQKNVHKRKGFNSRLDELQAAILRTKLRHLDDWIERRRANADKYNEVLKHTEAKVPFEREGTKHVYYVYVLRTSRRDSLEAWLNRMGVATGKYYPTPVHLQEAYKELRMNDKDLPETLNCSKQTLALPMFPELRSEEIEYITDAVSEFFRFQG